MWSVVTEFMDSGSMVITALIAAGSVLITLYENRKAMVKDTLVTQRIESLNLLRQEFGEIIALLSPDCIEDLAKNHDDFHYAYELRKHAGIFFKYMIPMENAGCNNHLPETKTLMVLRVACAKAIEYYDAIVTAEEKHQAQNPTIEIEMSIYADLFYEEQTMFDWAYWTFIQVQASGERKNSDSFFEYYKNHVEDVYSLPPEMRMDTKLHDKYIKKCIAENAELLHYGRYTKKLAE